MKKLSLMEVLEDTRQGRSVVYYLLHEMGVDNSRVIENQLILMKIRLLDVTT